MLNEEEWIKKKLLDSATKSYKSNQFIFSDFLGMAELDVFYRNINEFKYVGYKVYGGVEGCERCMVRFGSVEELGYEQDFPIMCVMVKPLVKKFADELSHRDYLGALMNLGIERCIIGDIIIRDKIAYIFCVDRMAQFIIDNFDKVKHTHIKCEIVEEVPDVLQPNKEEITITAASERADIVISKIYNLSRSSSIELFRNKKVFINGKCTENNSINLKNDDIVSVRGYGRFEYIGCKYINKKGKSCINISKWI